MSERFNSEIAPPPSERALSTREALEALEKNYERLDPLERLALDLATDGRVRLSREAATSPLGDEERFVLFEALMDIAAGKFPEPWHRNAGERLAVLQRMIDTNPDWYRMMATPESLRRAFAAFGWIRRFAESDETAEECLRHDDPDMLYALYFPEDVFSYFFRDIPENARFVRTSNLLDDDHLLRDAKSTMVAARASRVERWREKRSNADESAFGEWELCKLLSCPKEQIAHSTIEINASTRAYLGPLKPGVLQSLPDGTEYVYTSFPPTEESLGLFSQWIKDLPPEFADSEKFRDIRGRVHFERVAIGGVDEKDFVNRFSEEGFYCGYEGIVSRIEEADRKRARRKLAKVVRLVRLSVRDLGLTDGSSTSRICARAEELGLGLCLPEDVLWYRIQYRNQLPMTGVYVTTQRSHRAGDNLQTYTLSRDYDERQLSLSSRTGREKRNADDEFLFRFRQEPPKDAKAP